jgi:hypothetical protein
MAGEDSSHATKSSDAPTAMTAEDYAKEVKEAQLRSESMLSKISRQLSEHASQQAANLAKQSEKIDQVQSQIQARSTPKRSDRIANPEVKRHMQPLEQAQQVISHAKSVFEGHLDGSSPLSQLSEDQVAALKDQCDEGEKTIIERMQFLENWDSEGLEVAFKMLRLRDEASRDPAEVPLVNRAKKSLAEKRKMEEEATKPAKDQKSNQFQNPKNPYMNRNRSPSPSPQWFHPPQPVLLPAPLPMASSQNPIPSPIYQSQFFPSLNRSPSPAPSFNLPPPAKPIPGPRPPVPSMTSSRAANLQCWSCQQFGHVSASCPNSSSLAANAGRGYF